MKIMLVVAVSCALAACGRDKPAQQPLTQQVADDSERGTTFAQDSLRDWFIDTSMANIPGTEADIIATLGEPDSIVRLPSASKQDPMAYDTIIEAHYPSLAISILKIAGDEVLQSIWVADSTYFTGPIRLGTDTTTLRTLLGPPMLSGERPGYVCRACSFVNESVRFDLMDGKVTGMLFTFPAS